MTFLLKMVYKFVFSLNILIMSIIVGTTIIVISYSLPCKYIFLHAKESIYLYERGQVYPSWMVKGKGLLGNPVMSARLDDFTDSIMLKNVIYPTSQSIVHDAMLNPRHEYKNTNVADSLVRQLKGDKKGRFVRFYSRY